MDQKPCSNNKTHVQIIKLTCRLNMDFELLISQDGSCFDCPERSILEFYDDVRGTSRNWRPCKQHSELAAIAMLVCCRIWRVYMEFIWSFGTFSSQFAVVIVCYARTTIIHGYFIAITFAGSLGRYLNARPSGLVLMLMHEKPWMIPNCFNVGCLLGTEFWLDILRLVSGGNQYRFFS